MRYVHTTNKKDKDTRIDPPPQKNPPNTWRNLEKKIEHIYVECISGSDTHLNLSIKNGGYAGGRKISEWTYDACAGAPVAGVEFEEGAEAGAVVDGVGEAGCWGRQSKGWLYT